MRCFLHIKLKRIQLWTKVLKHFSKTNAFKLIIILCFWMKTHFSSIVTASPQTMLQNAPLIFICFNIEKGKRQRLPFTRGEWRIHNKGKYNSNFHMSQHLLSMIAACIVSKICKRVIICGGCRAFIVVTLCSHRQSPRLKRGEN